MILYIFLILLIIVDILCIIFLNINTKFKSTYWYIGIAVSSCLLLFICYKIYRKRRYNVRRIFAREDIDYWQKRDPVYINQIREQAENIHIRELPRPIFLHNRENNIFLHNRENNISPQANYPSTGNNHLSPQANYPSTGNNHLSPQANYPSTGNNHLSLESYNAREMTPVEEINY